MDAQLDPPAPSTTVNTGRLDVMQAEAAAAVAGSDRLVLVVGPAGAGKTTMLAAAVDDLTAQGRVVFGVAPTAKAARVLESETQMASDTVAKLLHEWRRTDRPPERPWRLPAGATVIVDEAGMIGTGDLHQLTHLADAQRWRLVLVGDPHQLQAVGRGGMFAELCAPAGRSSSTRSTASTTSGRRPRHLKLRHGDPAGLDAYVDHDRIFAGTVRRACRQPRAVLGRRPRPGRVRGDHDHHQRPRRRHQRRRPRPPPPTRPTRRQPS